MAAVTNWQPAPSLQLARPDQSRLRFGHQTSPGQKPDQARFSAVERETDTLGRGQKVCISMINGYQKVTRESKLAVKLNRQSTGLLGCGYKDLDLSQYSCSEFTKEAILKYGVIKGIVKGFLRILMCNPLTFRIKSLQKFCLIP